MGSSYSVVNDTNETVWVSDGVCHAALWGSLGGVALVTGVGAAALAGAGLGVAASELEGYTRVPPGGRYTKKGSLSLVWLSYVIRESGKMIKRDCWTGATAGSDNEYPVSRYFS